MPTEEEVTELLQLVLAHGHRQAASGNVVITFASLFAVNAGSNLITVLARTRKLRLLAYENALLRGPPEQIHIELLPKGEERARSAGGSGGSASHMARAEPRAPAPAPAARERRQQQQHSQPHEGAPNVKAKAKAKRSSFRRGSVRKAKSKAPSASSASFKYSTYAGGGQGGSYEAPVPSLKRSAASKSTPNLLRFLSTGPAHNSTVGIPDFMTVREKKEPEQKARVWRKSTIAIKPQQTFARATAEPGFWGSRSSSVSRLRRESSSSSTASSASGSSYSAPLQRVRRTAPTSASPPSFSSSSSSSSSSSTMRKDDPSPRLSYFRSRSRDSISRGRSKLKQRASIFEKPPAADENSARRQGHSYKSMRVASFANAL